jgi:hypothetical protein
VPVGKTDPVKVVGSTVAVKVTGWLTDGFEEDETTVVVVGLWLTVWVTTADVVLGKFESPL